MGSVVVVALARGAHTGGSRGNSGVGGSGEASAANARTATSTDLWGSSCIAPTRRAAGGRSDTTRVGSATGEGRGLREEAKVVVEERGGVRGEGGETKRVMECKGHGSCVVVNSEYFT